MKGSIRLFKIFGISINIHVTFFLLLILVVPGGIKWLALVIGVFFFVTVHELCHSLVAKYFGITVHEITLLPIGGISSMTKMPEKPIQEFLISIAGPLSNIVIMLVLFFPLKLAIGDSVLLNFVHTWQLSTATWPLTVAYLYWINLFLAGFNLLPAFPMDGGRVLRSLLATKLGYQKATKIAVNFGHVFALIFAYFGIIRFNIILVIIAVFIYTAASSEEMHVDVKETLKKFRVRDILPRDFITVTGSTTLAKILELIFHSHQEDFPIVEGKGLVGFATRQDIMEGMHRFGTTKTVRDVMRHSFPKVKDTDSLVKVQTIMHENGMRALPVMKGAEVIGVVTIEDIGRVYAMASQRT
ncbi:MAG: site-2 protease family protein [Candidatus Omnitrophica bacterium]|nr:site-2 protease family protein [Candidatus Omnitrophota bacterium]MDD5437254.1 site-2 protease family protein [Candidatus Omnitrophota bacterium]